MKRQALIDYRGRRSQAKMAKMYGVSQQLWSCWENGNSAPPPYLMKKLEEDTGVPMEEIFFDIFNQEK